MLHEKTNLTAIITLQNVFQVLWRAVVHTKFLECLVMQCLHQNLLPSHGTYIHAYVIDFPLRGFSKTTLVTKLVQQ